MSFDSDGFVRRRRTFEDAGQATCPCCGFPTIAMRGVYEICSLCGWEDDGEPVDPGTVVSGPNLDYSLAEARTNFALYHTAFRPGDRDFAREHANRDIKREIVNAYQRAVDGLTGVERAEEDARYWFARLFGI